MRIYPDKIVDEEFKDLGDLGHLGTLNDRQFDYFETRGFSGALADKFGQVGVSSFTVSFTGLTGGAAIIGDHATISYTTDPVSATETVKWSASSDPAVAATYGTGASPTDFSATTTFVLYLHVTDDTGDGAETVTVSTPIGPAAFTAGQWTLTAA